MSSQLKKLPTPAERIIAEFGQESDQFGIPVNLPDLALLRKLSIAGRLRYFVGVGATAMLTIIPTTGETLFIYAINATRVTNLQTITIANDGNTRLVLHGGTGGAVTQSFPFFDSLVGNGIKSFTLVGSDTNQRATVLAWVENTSRIRNPTI